ncbi:hypothetical protein B0H67DRAFT_572491 [Lasiosphaeris hirsuta]|uniref:Uncharacterized protein n=1 Tax=Lasiosphaeris hirsuta TaxID=260670 RepID=A0AA40DWM7_9PEZI|nr:hypothetical protein B0H67DRAFT_572491 [Lasiosphaeris hirsuta]
MECCGLSGLLHPQGSTSHKFSRRPHRNRAGYSRLYNAPAPTPTRLTMADRREYGLHPASPQRSRFPAPQDQDIDQRTVDGDDDGRSVRSTRPTKVYRVSIPSMGLKWTNLKAYLELEFPGLTVFQDQSQGSPRDVFIVRLPERLSEMQLQNIDNLKATQPEVDEFLRELELEKKEERRAVSGMAETGLSGRGNADASMTRAW